MTHPNLSKPIIDWQQSGVIRMPAKIMATLFIAVNLAFPLFIIGRVSIQMKILVAIAGVGVLVFIWSRPSRPKTDEMTPPH